VARSAALKPAVNPFMVRYEYLGNPVYQRIVPLERLDLLVGGIVQASKKNSVIQGKW
jgi:hypothetical protein